MNVTAVLAEMRDGDGTPLGSFATYLHTDTLRGIYISPAYRYEAAGPVSNAAVFVCDDSGHTLLKFPLRGVLAAGDSFTVGIPSKEQEIEWATERDEREKQRLAQQAKAALAKTSMKVSELRHLLNHADPNAVVSVDSDCDGNSWLSIDGMTVLGCD